MHIYFVNSKSSINGPYDITDSHRRKIIRIGDVIIRENDNSLSFLIVVSDVNNWSSCKCIDSSDKLLDIDKNTLLYSFDGISRRKGDIDILYQLLKIFDSSLICAFIDNAISILSYNCDLWDIDIFYRMHSFTPIEIDRNDDTTQQIVHSNLHTTYIFEGYLKDEVKELFLSLVNQNIRMRDVYEEVRESYPVEFREAIRAFINDYPQSTIYDTIEQ